MTNKNGLFGNYKTIDPEIEFEVKRGLSHKGYPELFNRTNLIYAMQMAKQMRFKIRSRCTLEEVRKSEILNLWLNKSTVNYHSYLVELIVDNSTKKPST